MANSSCCVKFTCINLWTPTELSYWEEIHFICFVLGVCSVSLPACIKARFIYKSQQLHEWVLCFKVLIVVSLFLGISGSWCLFLPRLQMHIHINYAALLTHLKYLRLINAAVKLLLCGFCMWHVFGDKVHPHRPSFYLWHPIGWRQGHMCQDMHLRSRSRHPVPLMDGRQ